MRKNFEKALKFTLSWEGGYSNDPDDPGGETFKGCTVRDQPWLKDKIHNKTLTDEEAGEVYLANYWIPAGCDSLPYPLDCVVFDCAVNMGTLRARNSATDAHDVTDQLGDLFQAIGAPYNDMTILEQSWPYLAAAVHVAVRMGEYEVIGAKSLAKFKIGWFNRCKDALKTFL